uniref:Uncharacterized protein n=1 Tax=Vespula pensylvanica TaxID=30213 RepID=A0A834P2D9_VESPE|nr:hypothetical protein H0235_008084 [Vespula pensylvanica]
MRLVCDDDNDDNDDDDDNDNDNEDDDDNDTTTTTTTTTTTSTTTSTTIAMRMATKRRGSVCVRWQRKEEEVLLLSDIRYVVTERLFDITRRALQRDIDSFYKGQE